MLRRPFKQRAPCPGRRLSLGRSEGSGMGQRPLYEACAFGEALLKMGYPLIASLRGRLIAGALTQSPHP